MGVCNSKQSSSLNYNRDNFQETSEKLIETSTPINGEDIGNNNIITPDSTVTETQTPENLEKIIINCKNYFESEKDFISKINGSSITQAYLLDLSWVNDWKINSNYEWIKKEYFDKGNVDIESIKKDILSTQMDKKFKSFENKDIEKYILDNDSKIKKMLEADNSCILINNKFLGKFITNSSIKPITLNFSPKQITIKLSNGENITFQTEDIILNQKKNLIILPKLLQINH